LHLLFKSINRLFKVKRAERLDKQTRRADISGNQRFITAGLFCQTSQFIVNPADVFFDTVLFEFEAIGAESTAIKLFARLLFDKTHAHPG
jgi:hypothetical protein